RAPWDQPSDSSSNIWSRTNPAPIPPHSRAYRRGPKHWAFYLRQVASALRYTKPNRPPANTGPASSLLSRPQTDQLRQLSPPFPPRCILPALHLRSTPLVVARREPKRTACPNHSCCKQRPIHPERAEPKPISPRYMLRSQGSLPRRSSVDRRDCDQPCCASS